MGLTGILSAVMSMDNTTNNRGLPRVAIIGGGVAGLACASELVAHGLRPVVYEKSRGLGGRLATRRGDDGVTFDHGAQYITARGTPLQQLLERAVAADEAHAWQPALHSDTSPDAQQWLVGKPTMNAWLKPLAKGLDLRHAAEILPFTPSGRGWRLSTRGLERRDEYDLVVCTVPAQQARTLAATDVGLVRCIESVAMAPCWALMLAFETRATVPFDVWRSDDHALAWVSRNNTKPGRREDKDTWVVHASPAWSATYVECDHDAIVTALLPLLQDLFGAPLPPLAHAAAHRWRYAQTITPLGVPFAANEERTLFLGGDWCLGAWVECGYESGAAIAAAVLENCG